MYPPRSLTNSDLVAGAIEVARKRSALASPANGLLLFGVVFFFGVVASTRRSGDFTRLCLALFTKSPISHPICGRR